MNFKIGLIIQHLSRTGSDHAFMLLKCGEKNKCKPFTFLNFWTEHESFKQVVRCAANDIDNPFFSFKEKLKTALTSWSKEVNGDI